MIGGRWKIVFRKEFYTTVLIQIIIAIDLHSAVRTTIDIRFNKQQIDSDIIWRDFFVYLLHILNR